MQSSSSMDPRLVQPMRTIDTFEASAGATLASITRTLNKQKEAKRQAKTHCTFCDRDDSDGPLKSCSRCKAARYCDQACQISDFKGRHKRECANFVHPPTTSAFLTKPISGERYPLQPVFAHWHEDGVGCWVTVAGCIDCSLQCPTMPLDLGMLRDRQQRSANREIVHTYKTAERSLLDLRVLVQNRRKDKTPILVFGSRAQVLSEPSSTSAVLRGAAEGDNNVKFMQDKVPRVALGVANDPWYKAPRLGIPHMNGAEVKKGAPLPENIKDPKEGTILLNTGEYVIIQLQFRVGDDDRIFKDWVALGALEAIFLPWAPWDGTTTPAALAASLPTAQVPASGAEGSRLLRAPFDQRAVRTHYADFIEHGEEAYMRSHFGDARADMSRSIDDMLTMMGRLFGWNGAQGEDTELMEQHLRDIGMGDIADSFASQR
ncbi:uncharacterized protein TRAVEDRAFT_48557 [Trametes versicolor FP-101664 SS1]|uniref:uncharacterized protein n=1 Tax=Trametes versicolor (strain FP-101664) TaxID=717944 RepID=UPI0004622CFB|nr:uncharacterized protein TRAVEDRAFT_48557 [Trametes versicolor FP-101664 SS1]EIW57518.1 hypothetical protein TRAVEDRAFT_48557 [Trametes versicolor FP-101664 SS1]